MRTPDELKQQRDNGRSKRGQLAEAFEQLKTFPWASFWSLSLVVGGLLLLSYFSSIEYLPDVDINSISATVAGVAVVGLFVVFIIGFGLTLPTLFVDTVDASIDSKKKLYILAQAMVGIVGAFAILINLSYDHDYQGKRRPETVLQSRKSFSDDVKELAAASVRSLRR